MTKLLLTSIAALSLLYATGAHTQQGLKPAHPLPSYLPLVCVTPDWTSEPCERRLSKTVLYNEPGGYLRAHLAPLAGDSPNPGRRAGDDGRIPPKTPRWLPRQEIDKSRRVCLAAVILSEPISPVHPAFLRIGPIWSSRNICWEFS